MSVSPLDLLYARGRLMVADHAAGLRFAFLDRRRADDPGRYESARAALDQGGSLCREMVEMVVLSRVMPRTERGLDALQTGLDALAAHFAMPRQSGAGRR